MAIFFSFFQFIISLFKLYYTLTVSLTLILYPYTPFARKSEYPPLLPPANYSTVERPGAQSQQSHDQASAAAGPLPPHRHRHRLLG